MACWLALCLTPGEGVGKGGKGEGGRVDKVTIANLS